ncbi:MAG: hypothetical protein U0Q16_30000 [Bryobacteraceae bacterium]
MHRDRIRWTLLVLVVNCLFGTLAALLWLGQHPLPAAVFEYGKQREWTGVVEMLPYPALRFGPEPEASHLLLVAPGKHGADDTMRPLAGRQVKITGSLIEREGRRMAEIVGEPIAQGEAHGPHATKRWLGAARLEGQIVDSKCFLGVMNPGSGKVHRSCAVRCISGGVPPVLIVRDGMDFLYVLLAGPHGEALRNEVLDYAAEPVSISGGLFTTGGEWLVLHADLATIRRE